MKTTYDYKTLTYNLNKYMDLKGIENYADLLRQIAIKLGKKGKAIYDFVENERSNFSKMLNGKRPLKYEYIIPLESIFGVSLAKLLNDEDYEKEIDKDEIPYNKPFRYYVMKDDPKLYKELDDLCSVDGKLIITGTDEYGKGFLDYVVEYKALNALRHLLIHHKFSADKFGRYNFFYIDDSQSEIMFAKYPIEVAKIIVNSGDFKLFMKTFNDMEYLIRYPWSYDNSWFNKDEFIYCILENESIFNQMFFFKEYKLKELNDHLSSKHQVENVKFFNQALNIILERALKYPEDYKEQIIKILKFGIDHNQKYIDSLKGKFYNIYTQYKYYLYGDRGLLCGNLISSEIKETGIKEIDELLSLIPHEEKNYYYCPPRL